MFARAVRDPSLPGEAERLKTALDTGSDTALDLPVETSTDANFLLRSVQQSDPLPNVPLRNVNVTESGLYDAMQLIAAAAGLSLSIEGGARGLDRYGAASVFRLNGTLPEVLERLSRSMGFFYYVRDGVLFVSPEQQFVLQAPPALTEDNMAGFTNNLQMLGARDTYLDRLNGSIVFRANRQALASIESYVKQLRAARVMIVYEGKTGFPRPHTSGDPGHRCRLDLNNRLAQSFGARSGSVISNSAPPAAPFCKR